MVKKDGAVQPEYHVNDYLCSVRVVTDADGEVLERNDYSGFGKRLASSAVTPAAGSANRYRFSGKEEQSFAGVPWQDFGARMYDPDLARWTTPDPLAEKYPGISPYVYCNSNPVNFVDPDGRTPETAWDILNVVYDVGAAVYNHVKKDHDKAREHWKNAAYDGLAVVVLEVYPEIVLRLALCASERQCEYTQQQYCVILYCSSHFFRILAVCFLLYLTM